MNAQIVFIWCYVCAKPFSQRVKLSMHSDQVMLPTKDKQCDLRLCNDCINFFHKIQEAFSVCVQDGPVKQNFLEIKIEDLTEMNSDLEDLVLSPKTVKEMEALSFSCPEEQESSAEFERILLNLRKRSCNWCTKQFLKFYKLKMHVLRHHTPRHLAESIKCDICNRGFIERHELRSHYAVHSNYRPFECQFCSMTFKTKQAHYNHMRAHKRAGLEIET